MSDDLFSGDHTETDEDTVTVAFEDLVGEGKKYKTNEDAAKALVEKDRFIERLKLEAKEAREAAQKRIKEEEFLDRLERLATAKPPAEQDTKPEDRGVEQPSAVKPEDIDVMIAKRLEEAEAAKKRKDNLTAVETKLRETYGEAFRRHVQSHAQRLGVGTEFLTDVAAKSPEAFYNLLGLNAPARRPDDVAPPRSSSYVPVTPGSNEKDYVYWREQRIKNGDAWYFDEKVQKQIWDTQKAMGYEKFMARVNQN